jgi:hypothetical protein
MQGAASDWVRAAGPVIVVAQISTEPAPLVLPPRDGGYLKNRFRQALLGEHSWAIASRDCRPKDDASTP